MDSCRAYGLSYLTHSGHCNTQPRHPHADKGGMNDIKALVQRIEDLPQLHRRHALERLSDALVPVEEHAAEWKTRADRKTVRGRPAQAER